jgi:hypothetical protein
MATPAEKPGLQAERTQLSWERSAFSFLIAGVLPLFGRGPVTDGRIVLPIIGALLAILCVGLGRRRASRVTEAPQAEVIVLGCATACFAAVIVVFSLF